MKLKFVLMSAAAAALLPLAAPSLGHAEVVPLEPGFTEFTTDDGVQVSLRLEGAWNKIDTANLTGTSREGRGDFKATAQVKGSGVKGAQLQVGVLFGCFAQLNAITATAQVQVGVQPSIEAGFPVPIVPKGTFTATVQPSLAAQIAPGAINATAVSQKSLERSTGQVRVRDVHLNIDGCLGPASIQVYASIGTSTDVLTDSATVYSQRMWI